MPKFSVTRRVSFTADQVFALAADVASYREFLPLVRKSLVRNREELPGGRESFESELVITYRKLGISETMISKVIIDRAANAVTSTAIQGPVQHLDVDWRIVPAGPEACDIHFKVDYALKSRSLQFILSGMFDMIVRRIMSAFEERAKKLYGAVAVS